MRTIISGSRSIWSYDALEDAISKSGFQITEVICGMAPGADSVGWAWAHVNDIKIIEMPADWNNVGRGFSRRNKWGKPYNPLAGYERNARMAKVAQQLIALHDGESLGTKHMIEQANDHGLRVFVSIPNTAERELFMAPDGTNEKNLSKH